ncbi:MAG: amino acid permease [Gammaproteobacteria bacterium]|nr:amino acid permease [Gammaproteobacteria bacterium]
MSKNVKTLSIFSLVMITVGSVDSIRNLPTTALFGSQLIFFFLFGALFFLLPTAFVSAELASSYPKEGGIYIWVKQAFGKRWGFLAIWLQWIENVIWYPILLSFLAGNFGFLIAPTYANNPTFLYITIVTAFTLASAINFFGMKSSAWFSNFCAITGLLIPMTAIIGFGVIWLISGNTSQISWQWHSMIPSLNRPDLWVSLTGVMMSLCGIEIATVHAKDVSHPQKSYPKVLFYSVLIICSTMILGSLAIAIVIPTKDINLVAGIMQAFQLMLSHYHLEYMMPIVALMIVMGGMGSVSNWIIAPTMGLMVAASDGCLPSILHKTNRHGAPIYLLALQVIFVWILATLFMFMPSVSSSYWLLTALAAQLYMLMYALMFMAIIRLRKKQLTQHANFKIPGGMVGFISVIMAGMIGVVMTFGVSFLPPDMLDVGRLSAYHWIQVLGLLLMMIPPFILKIQHEK